MFEILGLGVLGFLAVKCGVVKVETEAIKMKAAEFVLNMQKKMK